ncbi:MAG: hypothetical protein N4Q32_01345 [Neisseriaceae bacterium]|nr:hypothetical protein [Neisseriaceae bacterium]
MTGKSIREAVINEEKDFSQNYFVELPCVKAYVNEDNWKIRAIEPNLNFIQSQSQSQWELFDLKNDPLETIEEVLIFLSIQCELCSL